MQTLGLEWLYRLIQEPRRLWRRYLRYNPRFVAGFCKQYASHVRARRRKPDR
jgi:N-acetylglucosaminyldiphosphoundecaprenol N-acetyl-beta-D-mannosaminyltransferase